jgi:hypothetical protein
MEKGRTRGQPTHVWFPLSIFALQYGEGVRG